MTEPLPAPSDDAMPRRAERAFALVALVLALSLHAVFFLNAGSLWRDEINSVNIARTGSLAESIENLEFDSFPAGWFVVLRPFAAHFGPGDASAWRLLGVLTGLLLAAAVTLAGIDMTGRPPILAISLLLLNAVVLRFGDSVRGYGIGMLFAVLAYWTLFRYAEHRSRSRSLLALLASVASVHLLYYNAFLVFGACCAAAVACLMRGARRAAAGAIAIGVVAAATLVPYGPVIRRARGWNDVVRYDVGMEWIHRMGAWSIARSGSAALLLWYAAITFAIVAAIALAVRATRSKAVDPRHAFHAVALALGGATYLLFLLRLGYYMGPWYYLVLMVLVAVAADALLAAIASRTVRLVAVLVLSAHLALSFGTVSRYVGEPATNVPEVAAEIAKRSSPDDFVLISPWEIGVSWKIHADTPSRWSTVPPIASLDWHRYDLLYPQLDSPAATEPLIRLVDETLAANRRVLVLTLLDYPSPPGKQPAPLTRAGDPSQRLIERLQSDRYRIERWPSLGDAIGYEDVSVLEVRRAGAGS
ncbi:MAG: hypothetical protein ACSLFQ_23140 [Thermoanaerobaculia bacterium]